jgi:hypothetical protein
MIVETKGPGGKIIDICQVDFSKSGMIIMITDSNCGQILLNRLAWPNIIKAVDQLFAEERKQAERATQKLVEEEGPAD